MTEFASPMAPATVMTVAAFCEAACYGIAYRSHEEQSLRYFLGALRDAIARHSDISPDQFLSMLDAASRRDAPDVARDVAPPAGPFSEVLELLDSQISTLGTLEAQGVYENTHRGFGVTAEDDERWYNFDTPGYVECACAGALDDEAAEPMPPLTAEMLVSFFECGRSYE